VLLLTGVDENTIHFELEFIRRIALEHLILLGIKLTEPDGMVIVRAFKNGIEPCVQHPTPTDPEHERNGTADTSPLCMLGIGDNVRAVAAFAFARFDIVIVAPLYKGWL
jgi:hypothetical protein